MNRVHVVAAVAALSLTSGVLLLASMQQPGVSFAHAPVRLPDRIAGIPAPEDLVIIREGDTFAVPTDKLFVATGLSRDNPSTWASAVFPAADTRLAITFDGVVVLSHSFFGDMTTEPTTPIPPGLTASAGTTISLDEKSRSGSNWLPSAIRGSLHGYVFDKSLPAQRIKGIPAPPRMMRVEEGTPFTVPAGNLFVTTGIGFDTYPIATRLSCMGYTGCSIPECAGSTCCTGTSSVSVTTTSRLAFTVDGEPIAAVTRNGGRSDRLEVPGGYVAHALSVVSVSEATVLWDNTLDICGIPVGTLYLADTTSRAVVFGYLADE